MCGGWRCVPDRIGPTPSCGYCGTGRNSRAFSAVIVPIDDLEDPRLEPYRDVRDRDLRGRDDLFLVESKRVVARFVEHHEQVHSLLLSEAGLDNMADVLRGLPDHIPVYVTSLAGMIQIAGFRIHRGVLAAGHRPTTVNWNPKPVWPAWPRREGSGWSSRSVSPMWTTLALFFAMWRGLRPMRFCWMPLARSAVPQSVPGVGGTRFSHPVGRCIQLV